MKHSELGDCPECARIDRDFAKEVPPPIAKFDKGDLVEARVQWRIGEDNPFRMADWETELLYPMTVIERAQPELPTEPGIYLDVRGNVAQLVADTTDYEERWFNEYGVYMTHSGARERAPFTRLEPVADTARKVLDAVIARTTMHCNACSGHLADIRKEFGVQS